MEEERKKEKMENSFLFGRSTRSALMSPSRHDRSLFEASTERDCGAGEARWGRGTANLIDSLVR